MVTINRHKLFIFFLYSANYFVFVLSVLISSCCHRAFFFFCFVERLHIVDVGILFFFLISCGCHLYSSFSRHFVGSHLPENYWHSWLWYVRRRCSIINAISMVTWSTKYWQSRHDSTHEYATLKSRQVNKRNERRMHACARARSLVRA